MTSQLALLEQVQSCRSRILRIKQFVISPEDLFQDTFLACSLKRNVDWSISHPDYIIRSAKDQISRHFRKALYRGSTVSFDALQFEIPDYCNDRGLCDPEVEFKNLRLALDSLPENHRFVITRHAMDGISFPQLANELDI